MEKFEEIQDLWDKQSDRVPKFKSDTLINEANQSIKTIKIKHFWTIGILSITVIVLLYYFFWIVNGIIMQQILGLKLMIFALILRILLEILSIFQFKKIDFTASFNNYINQLKSFYILRKIVHFVLTPIIYLSYCVGFISLLPLFQENFSYGFYLYILVSGSGFLVVFSFILFKAIRRDMDNLKFLKLLG